MRILPEELAPTARATERHCGLLLSVRRIGLAHAALSAIAQGRFGDHFGYTLDNSSPTRRNLTDMVDCLSAVTSTVPPLDHKVTIAAKPLTKLPGVKLSVVELCAGAGGRSS